MPDRPFVTRRRIETALSVWRRRHPGSRIVPIQTYLLFRPRRLPVQHSPLTPLGEWELRIAANEGLRRMVRRPPNGLELQSPTEGPAAGPAFLAGRSWRGVLYGKLPGGSGQTPHDSRGQPRARCPTYGPARRPEVPGVLAGGSASASCWAASASFFQMLRRRSPRLFGWRQARHYLIAFAFVQFSKAQLVVEAPGCEIGGMVGAPKCRYPFCVLSIAIAVSTACLRYPRLCMPRSIEDFLRSSSFHLLDLCSTS